MADALFIDVSNLNVLYMMRGKFVAGVNYSNSIEQLAIDSQALGNSYDVYFVLWPRQKGDGDVIVPSLASGNVSFYALRKELEALKILSQKLIGIHNIYLCNALEGYIAPSRVDNFQTILCYGTRFAHITVENRKAKELKIYNNQHEFFQEVGEDYSCYGDLDMIDSDSIRAQYTELAGFKRTTIVPLTSLIMAYNHAIKIPLDQAIHEADLYLDSIRPVLKKKVKVQNLERPKVEEEPEEEWVTPTPIIRGKVDWLVILMCVVCCACTFLMGFSYQFRNAPLQAATLDSGSNQFVVTTNYNKLLQSIYSNTTGYCNNLALLLQYAKDNEVNVTVTSMDAYYDRIIMKVSCNSLDAKDQFVYYISQRYKVAQTVQYNQVNNTDGSTTYEYGLTLT